MKSTRLSLRQLARTGSIANVMGAEDPEGSGAPADQSGTKPGAGEGGAGGAGSSSSTDDKSGGDPQAKIVALEEEKNRHYTARTEAERARDEAQAALEEIKRKEKSDLENAQADVKKREEKISAQGETIKRLAVQNAFLASSETTWHDPADALRLVDLSEVKIDDVSGEVSNPDALKAAIKKLADEKKYLVKTDNKDEKGGSGGGGTKPPASGKPPTDKSKDEQAAARATLANKYPALRAH